MHFYIKEIVKMCLGQWWIQEIYLFFHACARHIVFQWLSLHSLQSFFLIVFWYHVVKGISILFKTTNRIYTFSKNTSIDDACGAVRLSSINFPFFLHFLRRSFFFSCSYLSQGIPHYGIMNISTGGLLLQMNNLTMLYRSWVGVQREP